MPKKPTDYSKTIIYKIQHIDNPELLYVGSTTDFTNRKYAHKNTCNKPNHKCYNLKLYKMIRDNGGWDMFNMVIVKEFPCENKRQAEAEEDRIIRETKSNMNNQRAFITSEDIVEYHKQYREQNKEQIAEKNKQYREQNKEQIAERDKQYYEQNKDKIKQYREQNKDKFKQYYEQYREQNKDKFKQYYEQNKEQIAEQKKQYREQNKEQIAEREKQYREQNKEQIAERNKQYREQNKEQIAEKTKQYYEQNKEQITEQKKQYGKQKISCDCGCIIRIDSMIRHKRTKKHQDFMKSIEQ